MSCLRSRPHSRSVFWPFQVAAAGIVILPLVECNGDTLVAHTVFPLVTKRSGFYHRVIPLEFSAWRSLVLPWRFFLFLSFVSFPSIIRCHKMYQHPEVTGRSCAMALGHITRAVLLAHCAQVGMKFYGHFRCLPVGSENTVNRPLGLAGWFHRLGVLFGQKGLWPDRFSSPFFLFFLCLTSC